MQLRTFIFWPHLVAGVTAGVVVLIMSITGVLLTYERQMIAWADSHVRSTPPAPAARRLPIESLIHAFQRTHPGVTPTSVTVSADPGAPAAFAVPQGTLYVDAYSGARLGEGTQRMRRFMSELRAWHRWLAADGDPLRAPSPAGPTSCSSSSSSPGLCSGCRGYGPGSRSARSRGSGADSAAGRAISTGTTRSASGARSRSSSSW
jgi:hypothetical protein